MSELVTVKGKTGIEVGDVQSYAVHFVDQG
jgi:hypothetical protein